MSNPTNYIEINGRKYDATTGQLIGETSESVVKPAQPKPASGAVDGFVAPRKPLTSNLSSEAAKPRPKKSISQSRAQNNQSRSPQKSKTLVRFALKKPKHVANSEKQESTAQPAKIVSPVPHDRIKRANSIEKSKHINRFGAPVSTPIVKKVEDIPVAKKTVKAIEHTEKATVQKLDQFEQAIQDATSHLETYVEKKSSKRSRRLAFATVTLSIIIVGGFLVYQTIPAIKVKIASSKAGFSASLPGYSPAGYGLSDQISSSSGNVSLDYKSRTDSDRGYKITQSPSNWTSQSLINSFLVADGKKYETFDANGRTVYVYDNNSATWVDGGVWYKLEGNASLTSDQILKIVNSL